MTTTKVGFTPGPWTIERNSSIYGEYPIIRGSDGTRVIAALDGGKCEANLILQAAAPDLYAALAGTRCGTCGYVISGPGIEVLHGGSCSACKPARAALAKARGE